jgi:hypothetical protein
METAKAVGGLKQRKPCNWGYRLQEVAGSGPAQSESPSATVGYQHSTLGNLEPLCHCIGPTENLRRCG